jgi:hypothetical protein
MFAILSLFGRLFGANPSESKYKTKEIYDSLRSQALALRGEQVGAKIDDAIVAVLMETGYPEAVATLVAVVDGSTSFYFSNGGGIIGGGDHDRPNAAAKKLIKSASLYIQILTKAERTPLPKEGFTRFYFVTPTGLLTSEAKEQDLGENRHALSPLFHVAHELISEIRVMDEKRPKTK